MKTKYYIIIAGLLMLSVCLKAQIHSTLQGGSWYDTKTWVGERIPGLNDSVIVNGPVQIYGGHGYARHLYITKSGVLQRETNVTKLTVAHNLYVDGTLERYQTAGIEFFVGGNLVLNGDAWTQAIHFTGANNHYVWMHDSATFYGTMSAVESRIVAMHTLNIGLPKSDYAYASALYAKEIDLTNGFDLNLISCSLGTSIQFDSQYLWTEIFGGNQKVNFLDEQRTAEFVKFNDLTMTGNVQVSYSDMRFYGTVINEANIVSYSFGNGIPLSIYGDFINKGKLYSYQGYLHLHIYKNFVNDGICEVNNIHFIGNDIHELSCLNKNEIFMRGNMVCDSSKVVAKSDLYLASSGGYLNVVDLDMTEGYDLFLRNIYLGYNAWDKRTVIKTSGQSITMHGGIYEKCDLYNATLKGRGIVGVDADLYGHTINADTLLSSSWTRSADVFGDFTNNGKIYLDQGYGLEFVFHQNFVNNGLFEVNNIRFVGGGTRNVSCGSKQWISYRNLFECLEGTLQAQTDLYIHGGITYNLKVAEIDLTQGHDLYLKLVRVGETAWDKSVVIKGGGNTIYSSGNGQQYFEKCDIYDATLAGVNIVGKDLNLYGNCINRDTLISGSNNKLDVYGDFTNNGYVERPSGYQEPFTFNFYKSFTNNGIFSAHTINFVGAETQKIITAPGKPLAFQQLNAETSVLLAGSDLEMGSIYYNGRINAKEIDLGDNHQLSISNVRIGDVVAPLRTKINARGGSINAKKPISYFQNCDILDVTLKGIIRSDGQVAFHGNIINEDTLVATNTQPIIIDGNFINKGLIYRLGVYYESPNLSITGNVENNGIWQGNTLVLNGVKEQSVLVDKKIDAKVELHAQKGSSGFQWFKDAVELPNADASSFAFPNLSIADRGQYYCSTNEGNSRTIKIMSTDDTGTDNLFAANRFKIYPNPATDAISIESTQLKGANYTIVNLLGDVVLSGAFQALTTGNIKIDNLPNGYYLFVFQTASGKQSMQSFCIKK